MRAKTGRIIGALIALLTVMKGLPLAYAKDMQEDKEPVFDAADTLALALAAMTGMVGDLTPDVERDARRPPAPAIRPPPILPTGWCASCGMPFREAHHVTGRAGGAAERQGSRSRSCRWPSCRRSSRDH